MAKKSAFKEWFKAQFGSLPNAMKRRKISIRIHELEAEVHHLRREHDRLVWLDHCWDGALKGWTASQSSHRGKSDD